MELIINNNYIKYTKYIYSKMGKILIPVVRDYICPLIKNCFKL